MKEPERLEVEKRKLGALTCVLINGCQELSTVLATGTKGQRKVKQGDIYCFDSDFLVKCQLTKEFVGKEEEAER